MSDGTRVHRCSLRSIRLRDGALRWECVHAAAHPGRCMEVFLFKSRCERLCQHGRLTVQDRAVVKRVRRSIMARCRL
jgi:hypothetical protein